MGGVEARSAKREARARSTPTPHAGVEVRLVARSILLRRGLHHRLATQKKRVTPRTSRGKVEEVLVEHAPPCASVCLPVCFRVLPCVMSLPRGCRRSAGVSRLRVPPCASVCLSVCLRVSCLYLADVEEVLVEHALDAHLRRAQSTAAVVTRRRDAARPASQVVLMWGTHCHPLDCRSATPPPRQHLHRRRRARARAARALQRERHDALDGVDLERRRRHTHTPRRSWWSSRDYSRRRCPRARCVCERERERESLRQPVSAWCVVWRTV